MARQARVLIAGAGALGSVLGGLLGRAGYPVTLLGRAAHLDVVERHGLVVEGLFGAHRVSELACAASVQDVAGPFDLVCVTVKAYDTAATVSAVAPLLAPGGIVLSLQNGLGNVEAAAHIVGPERVLGARVIFGAEVAEPGRVRVTVYADPVLIGSPDPRDATLGAAAGLWAAAFAAAGIPAERTDALMTELWGKVLYNAALNPLGALLGVPYGSLPADPDCRPLMDAVMEEVFAVAAAEGVALRWPDAATYRAVFYDRLVPVTASHRSSMLQDLERGRPTEIDAINGYVAHRGDVRGIPTPVNTTLTRLIRARVRGMRGGAAWRR